MKKIFIAILLAFSFFTLAGGFLPTANAAGSEVHLTIFYGDGCPHCEKELAFLEKLEIEMPFLEIRRLEVSKNRKNAQIMVATCEILEEKCTGVPFTVVGTESFTGYLNDATTGENIKKAVERQRTRSEKDIVGEMLGEKTELPQNNATEKNKDAFTIISLPFFGDIDFTDWSLPLLTIVIAGLDGFNPCAMWALIFLISLLFGMQNRKKMFILGFAFIAASALVYFLFLAAWLEFFLFIGFISYIRYAIGAVAIASGIYHLREWHVNKAGVCKVGDAEQKRKLMDKFRKVTHENRFFLALLGIIALAFAVNLIELVCSAGLPAIYTHVLSLADLSRPVYYAYLILYIFIFMLDDLLIFIIAMKTLQLTGLSTKYSRLSNLIGGTLILLLGLILIFRPGLVMFG